MAFIYIHSVLGWLLLIGLLASIVMAVSKNGSGKEFTDTDKRIFLFTMILAHLQLIIGGIQYFLSGKVMFSGETMGDSLLRFFTVEHPLTMILAIVAITVGYSKSKRAVEAGTKFKLVYVWYGIGLVLILLRFPWKYLSTIGQGWFV